MENKTMLKNPEILQITESGHTLSGYDQDWYSTDYKRTRGCGPTVATMLLSYTAQKRRIILPFTTDSIPAVKKAMELVWEYVTPTRFLGTYSTALFAAGLERFSSDHALGGEVKRLPVPLSKGSRPSTAKTARFITDALAADCPVAFLNLQKGSCSELETWHWMLITAIDCSDGKYTVECFDNGNCLTFDLDNWLKTSRFGGGFVYIK